jgi:hypothetical protein
MRRPQPRVAKMLLVTGQNDLGRLNCRSLSQFLMPNTDRMASADLAEPGERSVNYTRLGPAPQERAEVDRRLPLAPVTGSAGGLLAIRTTDNNGRFELTHEARGKTSVEHADGCPQPKPNRRWVSCAEEPNAKAHRTVQIVETDADPFGFQGLNRAELEMAVRLG